MRGFLDGCSIKHKLGAAFGVVLLVLLAVSLAGLRGASLTEQSARRVVEHIQPAVLAVMELENRVNSSAAAMGFYLKSGEPAHKELYLAENQALQRALRSVRSTLEGLGDQAAITAFTSLAGKVGQFLALEPTILELTASAAKNMPAMAMSEERLNPRHMEILQALGEMLSSSRTLRKN